MHACMHTYIRTYIHTCIHFSPPSRCGSTRVMASSFMRFLAPTLRRITVDWTHLDEWSCCRYLYLTVQNKHPYPRWDPNQQPQWSNDRRPTPQTAWLALLTFLHNVHSWLHCQNIMRLQESSFGSHKIKHYGSTLHYKSIFKIRNLLKFPPGFFLSVRVLLIFTRANKIRNWCITWHWGMFESLYAGHFFGCRNI